MGKPRPAPPLPCEPADVTRTHILNEEALPWGDATAEPALPEDALSSPGVQGLVWFITLSPASAKSLCFVMDD